MWSVGCVFGELVKSRPILQGQNDLDQLKRIFSLCGSPDQNNMPNWNKLSDANKIIFEPSVRRLRDEYMKIDTLVADLMD